MSREIKPGDVAMVTKVDGSTVVALWGGHNWHCTPGTWARIDRDVDPRPLVVVDPEDRQQVMRLVNLATVIHEGRIGPRSASMSPTVEDFQAALRSLVESPKPPEPMGLGAVVEDDKGESWVRIAGHWRRDADNVGKAWADLPAVRVLSEGVDA